MVLVGHEHRRRGTAVLAGPPRWCELRCGRHPQPFASRFHTGHSRGRYAPAQRACTDADCNSDGTSCSRACSGDHNASSGAAEPRRRHEGDNPEADDYMRLRPVGDLGQRMSAVGVGHDGPQQVLSGPVYTGPSIYSQYIGAQPAGTQVRVVCSLVGGTVPTTIGVSNVWVRTYTTMVTPHIAYLPALAVRVMDAPAACQDPSAQMATD